MNTDLLRKSGLVCAAALALGAVATIVGGCIYKEYEVIGAGEGGGPGSSSASSSGGSGECPELPGVTTIACNQGDPSAIALSESAIFWTNEGAGQIMTAPKMGSGSVILVDNQDQPCAISVIGDTVFWATRGGKLMRKNVKGGQIGEIDLDIHPACALASNGASLFYFKAKGGGGYELVHRGSSGAGLAQTVTSAEDPTSLSVEGGSIAWVDNGTSKVFGGTIDILKMNYMIEDLIVANPCRVSVTIGRAFVSSRQGMGISIVDLGNNSKFAALSGIASPCLIAAGALEFFWLNADNGALMRKKMAKLDTSELVAQGPTGSTAIALDAGSVYWTVGGNAGRVLRTPR